MTWNDRWMSLARMVATWSKDRSRQTGAVIVGDRNVMLSIGWNGFPRGCDDDVAERHERPAKYKWTEHAERNAIYNATAVGISMTGATLFIPWYPCADCARAIIQVGIAEIVCVEPDWLDATWGDDFAVVREMFAECGISVVWHDSEPMPEAQ